MVLKGSRGVAVLNCNSLLAWWTKDTGTSVVIYMKLERERDLCFMLQLICTVFGAGTEFGCCDVYLKKRAPHLFLNDEFTKSAYF